jgi:hypothetical protein
MQWGFDGKPTWYAPKQVALWGMVLFMLAIRFFIWLASTYAPQSVEDGGKVGLRPRFHREEEATSDVLEC